MMLVDDDGLTRVDQVGFSARQVRIAGHRKGRINLNRWHISVGVTGICDRLILR